jgi:hypothetical protein
VSHVTGYPFQKISKDFVGPLPRSTKYVDALEHHCLPDPKADMKMLGDEFAEFINRDLEEEIDAGPPAQQQWPAGARQAPPPADGTNPRGTGEESEDPTPSSLDVRATSPAATEERGRRQSPTIATGGGQA